MPQTSSAVSINEEVDSGRHELVSVESGRGNPDRPFSE
jgi:hypothetical protein